MFELMDETSDKAIIQVIGLGEKGQSLCKYIESKSIDGIDFINQSVEDVNYNSDLNFYIIDRSDLADNIDKVSNYSKHTCLNLLIISNQTSLESDTKVTKKLTNQVDAFLKLPDISINNDSDSNFEDANALAYWFVSGIAELIALSGLICVDFSDIRYSLLESGSASIGSGYHTGNERAKYAIKKAISSSQFEFFDFSKAKSLIVNISTGIDLRLSEIEEVGNYIEPLVAPEAIVCLGSVIKLNMDNEMRVTIIAT